MQLNHQEPIHHTLERLVPRKSADTPLWVSEQTKAERELLLKQMSYVRSLSHRDFLRFTEGTRDEDYDDAVYAFGELQSRSYYIRYTFTLEKAPTR